MKLNKNVQKMTAGILASSMLFISMAAFANAAALQSELSDTQSSLKVGTASNHVIKFKTAGAIAAAGTTTITFSGSTDASLLTSGDVSADVGGTWTVVGTPTNVLVLSSSAGVSADTQVTLTLGGNKIINDTTPGTKTYGIATQSTNVDNGSVSVSLVSDDTVAVSATVNQSITFAISENTISFGNLTSANARYADNASGSDSSATVAHTLEVATNASAGYSISVNGGTLTSQQDPGDTITAIGSTPAVSSAGTEQFGINVAASDNGTVGATFSGDFGFVAGSATTVASETVPTATETYSLKYLANIAPLTEAGSYSTNLVYVATANF